MNKTTLRWRACRWLVGGLAIVPLMVSATVTDYSNITLAVTVMVSPPCVINGNRKIEVVFGDVTTTQVDGRNYRIPVDYTLSCTGATSNALQLQIMGTGASFDNTVLRTSKTGLGIELQQGASKLAVNHWLKFTAPEKPELWAVPVKQDGTTLTGGKFTAGATMKVEYP